MDPQVDTTRLRKAKKYANASLNEFLDNVEDLTKAIKDVDTPDIARVRAKVKIALGAAKSALADSASQVKSALSDSASQVRGQARQLTKTTDSYVRDNPWQVVGIAAVVGVVLGALMSRRSDD